MFENLFVKNKEQKTQTGNMFEGIFDKVKETITPTIISPTTFEERQSLSLGLSLPGETRTTTPAITEEEGPIAIAKTIGQGIARSFIAAGTEVREQLLVPKEERKPFGEATYTPQNETEKKIFGTDKPISFKTIGEETLAIGGEDFKQKWGKYSLPIGMLIAGMDITPIGGGKKELLKEASKVISKTDDIVKIAKALKPLFKGTDEGIEVLAKSLKLINKEDEVLKVLETAGKARGATPIAPEATKLGVSAPKGIIPQSLAQEAPKTLPQRVGKETIEQVFNMDKLNLGPEQISNIEKRLEALGLKTRTIRTFEDVKRAAQELGVDTRRLLTETAQSRITDKEVVALRNTINTLADDIIRQEKNIILNPKQEQILNIKLSQSEQMLDMALNKLTKGGTEAGRVVSAFKIIAEKTLDPTFWLKKAKTIAGGRKLTSDEVIAITDLIKKGDRQGLANFVSMLRNASFAEKAITLWKAGLLTSPTTHLANIGGNLTMAGLMTASDVFSTGFDIMASLVTGKRTTTIGFSTIAAKAKGFVAGTKGAKTYLTKGVYSADVLKKWDMPRQTVFKNKIINGYVQSVFRSLGAEDILFRQAAMAESFEKSAIVMAKNEKLSGQAFKARVKELLTNPTNEMVMNAIDAAEYATFQSPNALANFIRAGKAAGGEPLRATAEFVAPFTLTPTNIAARIMDFTPAGFIKAIIQGIRPATRSQKAIVESLGRAMTGTGIMALGTYLASKGLMTGNAPEDANDRAMFYAEGKQANSILIGNHWFQLNRISPIGNLMALGAEFNELSKEQEGAQLIGATALAGVKGLTQQTFLQGVSSALEVISEPERELERYVQRGVAGLVPSIIGRTARTIDPKLRIPENVFEAVEERIPVLRKKVAPRRDIFGEIAPVPGGQFNLFDPFAITKAKNDPVINEAKKIGAVIGMPSQTISGVKLDSHEYSVYQKVQGKILHETLLTLINSPDYQQLSIVDKNKAFDSYTRNIRTQLNDVLFPALMVKRYNLPKETNPQILRTLLGELFQNDKFKQFSEEKQSKVIKKLLEEYAGEK